MRTIPTSLGAGLAFLALCAAPAPLALAHGGGDAEQPLVLPGSRAATPEEQRFAAQQGAVILTAEPAEHRQAIAKAWANPQDAFTELDLHPSVLIGTAIVAIAYALGVGPLRRRYELGPPATKTQVAWFTGSCVLLLLALNGPMHHLSDYYLLSAHMLQHMLLALIYAPMLLAGIPGWLLSPILRVPLCLRLGRFLTNPLVAYLIFNAILIGWHLPPPMSWRCATTIGTSSSTSCSSHPPSSFGGRSSARRRSCRGFRTSGRSGILFVIQVPMVALGAFMTLAEHPLYPFYVSRRASFLG